MTSGAPGPKLAVMSDDRTVSAAPMRIVLELSNVSGTVAGTLTTADENRSFWGWLELMSALELAAGTSAEELVPARPGKDRLAA
jgi:hypothetical protein